MKLNSMFLLLMLLLVTACARTNNALSQPAKPIAGITSPAANSNLLVGQEVLITFNAADVNGIARVELLINGQVVMQESVEPAVNSYAGSYRWIPDTAGNQIIELRAFNVDNVGNDLSQIAVNITGAPAVEEPTATAVPPTDTPTPTLFTPTPASSPTAGEAEPTATANPAVVTSLVRLNVRFGPSTDYPIVGVLDVNESAPITGRDEFSAWWQIEFQSDRGNRGWVSSSSDFSTTSQAEAVPVVEAPPLEATSTPIPTEVPPTATPDPRPVILQFTAGQTTLELGQSTDLSWDLTNADAAYLRYDDLEEGVVAPGSKTVRPDKDTVYTLVARNSAGEVSAEITITVGTSPTPAAVLRDGKIRIADGQFIDFDQGLVLGTGDPRSDFQWSGSTQKFWPQTGATGSLLGRPYGEITLDECLNTAYDKPIEGIDGSTQVTGCYRTNEGRYGKFLVSEWDLAANLTIEWLTWQ